MIDVFFQGKDDWFLETSNGIRPVTSKVRSICDNHLKDLESKDIDICYTNISLRSCRPFSAVFKLTPGDEKAYSITNSKKILKERMVKLLPSLHPGSSFLEYVEKGLLSIDNIDSCYFVIQTSVKYSQEESAKKVKFKLKIIKTDSSVNTDTKTPSEIESKPEKTLLGETNLNRIKSLEKFRQELIIAFNNNNPKNKINTETPEPFSIPCKKETILEALKEWAKRRGEKKTKLYLARIKRDG